MFKVISFTGNYENYEYYEHHRLNNTHPIEYGDFREGSQI